MSWPEIIIIVQGIIIAGGGYLFFFMRNKHRATVEVLKETQVEKYVERIRNFKDFYQVMINEREREISSLQKELVKISKQNVSKDQIIEAQEKLIDDFHDNWISFEVVSFKTFLDDSLKDIQWAKKLEWDDETWERNLSMLKDKSIKKISLEDLIKGWRKGKKGDDNK